jgi:hypothetical protein
MRFNDHMSFALAKSYALLPSVQHPRNKSMRLMLKEEGDFLTRMHVGYNKHSSKEVHGAHQVEALLHLPTHDKLDARIQACPTWEPMYCYKRLRLQTNHGKD